MSKATIPVAGLLLLLTATVVHSFSSEYEPIPSADRTRNRILRSDEFIPYATFKRDVIKRLNTFSKDLVFDMVIPADCWTENTQKKTIWENHSTKDKCLHRNCAVFIKELGLAGYYISLHGFSAAPPARQTPFKYCTPVVNLNETVGESLVSDSPTILMRISMNCDNSDGCDSKHWSNDNPDVQMVE